MADKKTSEENALAKSGITLNTAIRLADGSTGDNYQISLFDLADVITLTSADAITLLSTPNAIMQGSDYKITSLGITGVSYVIISGRDMVIGKGEGKAYVSGIGQLTKCTYDVANNKIDCTYTLWAAIIQYDLTISIAKLLTNNSGETPTLSNDVDGVLQVTFTNDQLISDLNALKSVTAFYAVSDLYTAIGRYLNTNTYEVTLTRISDNTVRNPANPVLARLEILINISNL